MSLYCVSFVQHSREHLPLEAKEKRRAVSEENKECTDTEKLERERSVIRRGEAVGVHMELCMETNGSKQSNGHWI